MRLENEAIIIFFYEKKIDRFHEALHVASLAVTILFLRSFGRIVNLDVSAHPIKMRSASRRQCSCRERKHACKDENHAGETV